MYSYLCGDPFGEKTAPADFIVNFAHSGTIAHRLVHTISDGRNKATPNKFYGPRRMDM